MVVLQPTRRCFFALYIYWPKNISKTAFTSLTLSDIAVRRGFIVLRVEIHDAVDPQDRPLLRQSRDASAGSSRY
jgi:hypothetical protein